MPHLVLSGGFELARAAVALEPEVHRFERAVLKTEACWLRGDGGAMLVEGVVVEFSRPLHPMALIAPHRGDIIVRLWTRVAVERTRAVQRWLCVIAAGVQRAGAGSVLATNIAPELWSDLGMEVAAG